MIADYFKAGITTVIDRRYKKKGTCSLVLEAASCGDVLSR